MRTTLTLERDVVTRLEQELRRSGRGLKVVINETLRRGFGLGDSSVPPPRFEVKAHDFGILPGIDLNRLNQLVDELETEEQVRKLGL